MFFAMKLKRILRIEPAIRKRHQAEAPPGKRKKKQKTKLQYIFIAFCEAGVSKDSFFILNN